MDSDIRVESHSPVESTANLNEVAAPPRVYDPSEKSVRQDGYLENQLPERGDESHPSPRETRNEFDHVQSPAVDPEEKRLKHKYILKFLRVMYVVSYLILFSIIGTLLRLVIESLAFYPGTPVNTSVLWANVGGSMVMGFLSEDQELFRFESVESSIPEPARNNPSERAAHLKAHKKTVPLYIGLTTGFCGSLTSFSAFIRDVFLALSNNIAVPNGSYPEVSILVSSSVGLRAHNGGFSFMALIAVLFTEIGLSLAGLFLGAHIAIALSRWTPSLSQSWLRKYLDPLSVILACLSWAVVICLVILLPQHHGMPTIWSPDIWRGPFLFSLVFAPVGCIARFFISLKFNSRIVSFPLGTFGVNVGGTMVLGMAFSLQQAPVNSLRLAMGGVTGCQVLQGIVDGFCGSLTTVSTWVLELSDLRRRHAYVYGGVSVAVALCFLVVEIGSLQWTRGLATPACFPQ
ncbi:hypothetical protein Aspvir_002904 [Aspergillus viridinutans]|uniref:CrcB-like protein-domain-containing protein n=1 Tax=Aspergillus viridinutans TaxID=75553 RepID=A0A9P3C8Q1_ASPVI|nr:uncharacterized protein Aspvir_002904 [Aspergillus viridinutans]GIK07246.1 hypothetical protein Aspvir_002904 [Aspergillus viridinutans]